MKDEQKQFYKKNLLFIVIDGLNYSMVNRMINGSPVCPYISGLAKNNISFQNVYSQGSYTMSAINSLFTGEDTIHENIYDSFFGSHSQSVFDEFINSGYESFIFMPGMNLPKSKHVSRFEHMYFFEEEDAFCYFKYQFEYYKNIYEKGGMTDKDYERLEYLLDSIFDGLKYIISPAENVVHMMRLADYPWVEYEKSFENELGKYINDKNGYIRNVLSDLDGCTLFNDTFRCAGNYLPKEIIEVNIKVYFKINKNRY